MGAKDFISRQTYFQVKKDAFKMQPTCRLWGFLSLSWVLLEESTRNQSFRQLKWLGRHRHEYWWWVFNMVTCRTKTKYGICSDYMLWQCRFGATMNYSIRMRSTYDKRYLKTLLCWGNRLAVLRLWYVNCWIK